MCSVWMDLKKKKEKEKCYRFCRLHWTLIHMISNVYKQSENNTKRTANQLKKNVENKNMKKRGPSRNETGHFIVY